jgi:NitT/TauT family transport system substrate-binding protein
MRAFAGSRLGRAGLGLMAGLAALAFGAGVSVAQTPIKFSLDWKFEGPSAPFLLAVDNGYFKAEGLDVTIDPAAGSLEPITRVASGAYDMGFGDINALIRQHDQNGGAAAKAVFMVYNKPPFAIIGRKSRGVASPKDLEGRKLGAPAADGAYAQWPVFVQAAGIDATQVTIVNVGVPIREPMLASGEVDAITGYAFSSYVSLKDRGVPADDITVLMMADYGVALYGNAIVVNSKFAAEKPEAVKAFLRAFLAGLKDAIRNPQAAIDAVIKRNSMAKKEVELERLQGAIKGNIITPEVRENGLGAVDLARLEEAIDQIALARKLKTRPKPADVFDSAFLPPAADRGLD